jgi:hypothetical protein
MDQPRTRRSRWLRLLLPVALALMAVVGLTACGGNDPDSAIATLGDGDDDTQDVSNDTGSDEPVTEEERQQAMLDFAKCMRENGVDMPDPQFDGEGRASVMVGGAAGDGQPVDPDTMEAAQDACEHIMEDVIGSGPIDMDPEEQERMKQQALDFAKCMRDHGIDMPDPQFESGGRMTQALSVDPNDPAFQAAQEECRPEDGGGPFTMGSGPAADGDE